MYKCTYLAYIAAMENIVNLRAWKSREWII